MTEIPQKIGRYEIIELIGKGGMGVVYKARDPNIGRQVALKVIKPALAADEDMAKLMKERFRREAQAAGVLQHSGIVTVYDAGDDNGVPFIAMEFVHGRPLDSILEHNPHALAASAPAIISQVARAVAFAHEHGVIHRDLKPANIILTESGEAKVMDFGIAKLQGSDLTRTGSILGSGSYMSPEQISGQPVDQRTDVFSLGVVLYELLAGERPFLGENFTSIAYRVVQAEPPPPSAIKPTLDPAYDAVIRRALAKRPDDRYVTALELAQDLERIMGGEGPAVVAGAADLVALPPRDDSTAVVMDGAGATMTVAPDGTPPAGASAPPMEAPPPEPPPKERPSSEVTIGDMKPILTSLGRKYAQAAASPFSDPRIKWGAIAGVTVVVAVLIVLAYLRARDPYGYVYRLMEDGKHDKAVGRLQDMVKDHPEEHLAWFLLGQELAASGDFKESLGAYSQALDRRPEYKESSDLIKPLLHAPVGPDADMVVLFIVSQAGKSSRDTLREALEDPDYNVHWNAAAALEKMKQRVDKLSLYVLDLKYNDDCAIRKEAAQQIADLGGRKVLADLEAAKAEKRNQDECMGDALDKAIEGAGRRPASRGATSAGEDFKSRLKKIFR